MKNINMLSPYSFHYLWKYEIGKQYICKLANELLNDNEEYVLLPFFNEKLNNVRSYVILESSSKILFIDFNFKKNDNLLKTDLLLMKYLKYTNKKAVKLIIINNYKGINNEIDNIYLNFSDPWPKLRHNKRRLTSKIFLEKYEHIFKSNITKTIELRTDNEELFIYSLETLSTAGYHLSNITFDLNATTPERITTEYEDKFSERGNKIYYLKASK